MKRSRPPLRLASIDPERLAALILQELNRSADDYRAARAGLEAAEPAFREAEANVKRLVKDLEAEILR